MKKNTRNTFAFILNIILTIMSTSNHTNIKTESANILKTNIFDDNFLPEQYQDIIINNQIIKPGVRECAHRYEALKKILDTYERPITVLDIGASQGYFSFRIAHDYDATCVMIEGDYNNNWKTTEQLLELCKRNTDRDNIVFLRHRITPEELERLATCEHFDVVLGFNILHHLGTEWKKATDALLNLGDTIIIETPPSDDAFAEKHPNIRLIEEYLKSQNGTIICQTPRHTNPDVKGNMYLFERTKSYLQRAHWFVKKLYVPGYPNLKITSNRQEKTVEKILTGNHYQWHKGINLLTFKMLGGAYPEQATIEQEIKRICDGTHTDFFPWNMIIQGNDIVPIDTDDTRWTFAPEASLEFTLNMLKNANSEDMLRWFLTHWKPFAEAQGITPAYISWCFGS